jgi:hypothetical protein
VRQVFSSPRIENVEGVAKYLEEAGIEVRITNGRGWRGAIRGNFSYREGERKGPAPAVWVVRSEDSPRARAMLREAGLLRDPRTPLDSYLPQSAHERGIGRRGDPRRRRPLLLKLGVLVLIGVAIGLGIRGMRRSPPAAPTDTAATPAAPITAAPVPIVAAAGVHEIPTPPALARALVARELDVNPAALACLAIDGADPPTEVVEALSTAGSTVRPASACDGHEADARFEVSGYRTDGSGIGTVRMQVRRADDAAPQLRGYDVERRGYEWLVRDTP